MAANLTCGLPTDEVVLANQLWNCTEDFPKSQVDWDIGQMRGMTAYYSVLGSLGVLIVISNLMILVGIVRDRKLREQTYMLQIAGQAMTDLLVGMLIIVFHIGTLLNGRLFVGGHLGCSIYGFGIVASCHCTVFSLSWIANSRKLMVLDNQRVSHGAVLKRYVLGVLGTTFFLGSYYSLVSRSRMVASGSFCNPIYNMAVLVPCAIFILVPIMYIVRVYYRIHKMMITTMLNARAQHTTDQTAGQSPGKNKRLRSIWPLQKTKKTLTSEELAKQRKARQQVKATRLMIMMCGSILVAWFPLYIYFLMVLIRTISGHVPAGQETSEMFLGLAAALSSLCSPTLYGFANRTLRAAMLFAFLPLSWKEQYLIVRNDPATKGCRALRWCGFRPPLPSFLRGFGDTRSALSLPSSTVADEASHTNEQLSKFRPVPSSALA